MTRVSFYLSLIHLRTGADSVIEQVDRCECLVTNVTTWLYMQLYGNSSMQTVLCKFIHNVRLVCDCAQEFYRISKHARKPHHNHGFIFYNVI